MRYSDIVYIANSLQPCVRTRHAIECNNCARVIAVHQIYFTNIGEPDNEYPWCRDCGLKLLYAMHIIDIEAMFAFPVYGPLPLWVIDHTPLHWVAPAPQQT